MKNKTRDFLTLLGVGISSASLTGSIPTTIDYFVVGVVRWWHVVPPTIFFTGVLVFVASFAHFLCEDLSVNILSSDFWFKIRPVLSRPLFIFSTILLAIIVGLIGKPVVSLLGFTENSLTNLFISGLIWDALLSLFMVLLVLSVNDSAQMKKTIKIPGEEN